MGLVLKNSSEACSLTQDILKQCQQLSTPANICVAYSGGVDSHVLLDLFHQLQQANEIQNLRAIHINHGLQSQSDQWQQHCQNICDGYHVPLTVTRLHLAEQVSSGIEEAARNARYQFFESELSHDECLVMGHHMDDQAETILFRLLRGTGLSGAVGIPKKRKLAQGMLFRPLLDTPRKIIESYAHIRQLCWIEDPSNQTDYYSRNFLRNQVTPLLQKKWPSYLKSLQRFSSHCEEQAELAEEIALYDWQAVNEQQKLNIDKLKGLSTARQKNLLRYWSKHLLSTTPSHKELTELLRQFHSTNRTQIHLSFAGSQVQQLGQWLVLAEKIKIREAFDNVEWKDLNELITLSNGFRLHREFTENGLRPPLDNERVYIKMRQGGERCLPDYRQKSTNLKRIFQELNVPAWQRKSLPIIYYNDQIVAIPGVFICQAFKAQDNETSIQLVLTES